MDCIKTSSIQEFITKHKKEIDENVAILIDECHADPPLHIRPGFRLPTIIPTALALLNVILFTVMVLLQFIPKELLSPFNIMSLFKTELPPSLVSNLLSAPIKYTFPVVT